MIRVDERELARVLGWHRAVHTFVYSVRVDVPHAGSWPLAAVLDGFPAVRGESKIDVDIS
jgi:hypothetical protein